MSRAPAGSLSLWCASLVLGGVALGVGCQRDAPALQGLEAPSVARGGTAGSSAAEPEAAGPDATPPPNAVAPAVPAAPNVAMVREMAGAYWVHVGDAPPLMPEARSALTDVAQLQAPTAAVPVSLVATAPVALDTPAWLHSASSVRLLHDNGSDCIGTVGEQRTIYAWQPRAEEVAIANGLDPETDAPIDEAPWTAEQWISNTLDVAQGDVWARLTTTGSCEGVRWAVADGTPTLVVESLAETIGMADEGWDAQAPLVAAWQQLPAYQALQANYAQFRAENPSEPAWPEEVLNQGDGAYGSVRLGPRFAVAGATGSGCGSFGGSSWALFERTPSLAAIAVADDTVSAELPYRVLVVEGAAPVVAGDDWIAWPTADGWQRRDAIVTSLECGC